MSDIETTGYILSWKRKDTDFNGHSQEAYRSKDFVLKRADQLNKEFKHLHHYVTNAPANTPFIDITDYSTKSLDKM